MRERGERGERKRKIEKESVRERKRERHKL